MIARRRFLMTAAAVLAAPPRLWANTSLEQGAARIDTLSDGSLMLSPGFLFGAMPQAELHEILTRYDAPLDRFDPPCNVTLYRDGMHTVLFDVGAGPDFQPTAGKLTEALSVLGLAPEDITHVLFTHGHPDHLWGVLDEFDEPVFPNALHMMGRIEHDFWADPETVNRIDAPRQGYAVGALRRLQTLGEIRLLEAGEEALPGISAQLTPGHTPGHMAFRIEGPKPALVLGDCLSNHHVAFERPEWLTGSDHDRETAAATRVALLAELVSEEIALVGYHLPGGGIGRVERAGRGYRFALDF
ncbi:glyoxylase-like metal-dependent hydrolase (beta-lactamase superfamily II) [Rhodobacter sp. JA431]|uniref:MBL fold metallo-hydrolase n=1 Tax=Rhodobacter sp. JA431 TaxID=570013 RepID=UPI000BCA0D55|nr:MBL fold metallo-hydrolase [Rhodobacter sp. JA431]SOC00384.1 glyoxylase-like metal-dependent hydrolase (beta-lactamase superfamily II) [Rhodobacter sp. JA431]